MKNHICVACFQKVPNPEYLKKLVHKQQSFHIKKYFNLFLMREHNKSTQPMERAGFGHVIIQQISGI
jgi:hypothetical protein